MEGPGGRLEEIIAALRKPLVFASKDSFRHLGSIRSLEPLVASLCAEAAALCPGAPFDGLSALFAGFDAADPSARRERVEEGLAALERIEAASLSAGAPPPEPDLEAVDSGLKALKTPLQFVKGIGPKLAERLGKKGLGTVEDLLYYLPIRYEDRSSIRKIRELSPGASEVTTGEVLAIGEAYYGRRRVLEMAVGDGGAILRVKWFHYGPHLKKRYKNGQRLVIFGPVTVFGAQKEMIHPDIEILSDGDEPDAEPGGMVPVYSQVENFHQKTIRKIMKAAVEGFARGVPDGVPFEARARQSAPSLSETITRAHLPSSAAEGVAARKAMAFDELFMLETGLALRRAQIKREEGIAFINEGRLEKRLRELLPFRLTGAQSRVAGEIAADMASPHPMNRLVQGDVGSGKTIVSLMAALTAIESGYQAALMAPTEILAEQHYLLTRRYAEAVGIRPLLMTGKATKAERARMLKAAASGEADLVIGTHALIQKDVEFKRLGLAVIDEQHRFGVVQRSDLRKKGFGAASGLSPDILIMTATPIPRTLSMTVFGDLDVSVIDELPPGRTPVRTRVLREKDRAAAYDAIRKELSGGSQCYIVYPLVEESKELSLKDATNMKEHLERDIFREWRVGLLHGRMKAAEKEETMAAFKGRRLDILVATTVIEVGVDVPNATVMLIEHAERFGLSQLHQLRGRVGRGEKPSQCLLLAGWSNSEDTWKRLKVMEETNDGFRIAEEDLKIRGPGDFLGTRQAGLPEFRLAEALSDMGLLKRAREEAVSYLRKNPALAGPEGEALRMVLKARWEHRLELVDIG